MKGIRYLLLLLAAIVTQGAWARYAGEPEAPVVGDGSVETPYELATAANLYWFAQQVNSASVAPNNTAKEALLKLNAILTADIVINDGTFDEDGVFTASDADEASEPIAWDPIGKGANSCQYKGHFDGQGHSISGLYINQPSLSQSQGLFGDIYYATIENVGVVNSYIQGKENVGAICGYSNYTWSWTAKSYIRNCWNTSRVKGTSNVAGILGRAGNATSVSNCWNSGKISSTNNSVVAGISVNVGDMATDRSKSELFDCYNTGEIINLYTHNPRGISQSSGANCYTTGNYSNEELVTHKVTDEQMASGEVCFLLNHASSDGELVWHQDLATEAAPQLRGSSVVYRGYLHPETCSTEMAFTNDPNEYSLVRGEHHFVNGFCDAVPGQTHYEPAVLNGDTYEISNAGQLYWYSGLVGDELGVCDYDQYTNPTGVRQVNNINARLMNDITVNPGTFATDGTYTPLADETPRQWMPIGRNKNNSRTFYFKAVFDGQQHVIRGLYYNGTGSRIALVGYADSPVISYDKVIRNVGLENTYFKGNQYVASFLGTGTSLTIANCYSTATIVGASSSGYVAGCSYGDWLKHENCLFTGSLTGYPRTAIGNACTNCYYISTVPVNENQASGAKMVTAGEFATGRYAWLLNGSTHDGDLIWKQTIGTDAIPTFNAESKIVYAGDVNDDHFFLNEGGTLSSLIINDGSAFSSPLDFTATSVTFNRNIVKDGGKYSFVVPFDIPVQQVAELGSFYQYAKVEDGKIYFDDIAIVDGGEVKGNVAYFFDPAESITSITVENAVIKATTSMPDAAIPVDAGLYGTYSKADVPEGAYGYVEENGEACFVKAGSGNTINPFRAYLWLGSNQSLSKAQAVFTADDDVDAIQSVGVKDHCPETYIYDINGQRIRTPRHGDIYIKYGKTFIK